MTKNPFTFLANLFSQLFGLHWSSPPWLQALRRQATLRPFRFWSFCTLLLLTCVGAAYGIYHYQQLPRPTYVTAHITEPGITPNDTVLRPEPVLFQFGIQKGENFTPQSVAPLGSVGKPILEGITISPTIAGVWTWLDDNQLQFTPKEDWPAGQSFKVRYSKTNFDAQTNLQSLTYHFKTKPLTAEISAFTFYQNPTRAEDRYAVATVQFNYPIDPNSLSQHTHLQFQSLAKDKKGSPLAFSYTYDPNKRVAYLHSDPIQIQNLARYVELTLNSGIQAASGPSSSDKTISSSLLIPDAEHALSVLSNQASIVRDAKDKPEQVLSIETSLGVSEEAFNKAVHIYVLPKDYPATATEPVKPDYAWQNPGEVDAAILSLSKPLNKRLLPSTQNYATLHSMTFEAPKPGYLFVQIDKGMPGFGDFTLHQDYQAVIPIPALPQEIRFLHKGSLLALSSEKKLSVLVRGLPAVQFSLARVLPDAVNQLVTQTQGDFNNPYFINPSFNQQNISQIFTQVQTFDASKYQYTALDIGKYVNADPKATGPQGLFLIQATGWDPNTNTPLDAKANRLILVTDLGLLVKDNADATHDVFVQSITAGTPAVNATVSILGKNGLPLLTRTTDKDGLAHFPSFKDFIDDREPTVYLANLNQDVSFIPFANASRQLNFSKFDTGGVYGQTFDNLRAFLFSDRGLYRPGDKVHVGMIVKQGYTQSPKADLPLQATVIDPRGNTIYDTKLLLDASGFITLDFKTEPQSPTGQYTVNLTLIKDDKPETMLGYITLKVMEFQPDTLRIGSELLPKPSEGWIAPADLKASVTLSNLYGTPATDRKVSAKMILAPQAIAFDAYPEYHFLDPLEDPKKPAKVLTDTLSDRQTDNNGQALFDLHLDRFEKATYQLTFFAEGFEGGGGRSVSTQVKALVSPLPYFIGYKTAQDLSFIKQNAAPSVQYIAINPQLKLQAVKDLTLELIALNPITTLVKKPDGTLQYQSIVQSTLLSKTPFSIQEQGSSYLLPTQNIGHYALRVVDSQQTVLSNLSFQIVGASQTPLAENAELSVHLDKEKYQANGDIALQITSPYTGSGLITIERDKVYAQQWFKTDTTNSLQTIHIPADFQGNGYVNVAFVRDWNSPELAMSPLSYYLSPFEISHDKETLQITLTAPKHAKPGEPFTMQYQTDKPSKIVVFAVDEGILQAANYRTPDPLSFFFQKRALEVITQQTVDLILPQFFQDKELSAAGGDGSDALLVGQLNPFKRKVEAPVVYWSGLLDADSTPGALSFTLPDYFNGSLRIMAVAVSQDALGQQETKTEVKGDFIISPQVPTFVAPGDRFEISATLANNLETATGPIQVTLGTTPGLAITGVANQSITITPGQEKTLHFALEAKDQLGDASVVLTAHANGQSSQVETHLSIRPASPLITEVASGAFHSLQETKNLITTFYPQLRQVKASLASSPLVLLWGLQTYLDNFPYQCTEQLTSRALPLLAMNTQPFFEKQPIQEKVQLAIQQLGSRQLSDGGFSYWPGLGANLNNDFASIYAMHFLTLARIQGFTVPDPLFYRGLAYLKDRASRNASDSDSARLQAYAIYVLTLNEIVTSNYITNLQLYLQKDTSNAWQKELTGVYLAASYQMLKNHNEAEQLITAYQPNPQTSQSNDFYDADLAKAQYLYIIAKHFPSKLAAVSDKVLPELVQALNANSLNTLLAGYTSLALGAYPPSSGKDSLSMTEIDKNNKEQTQTAESANYQSLWLSESVKQIRFNNPNKNNLFYQLVQTGFDKTQPKEAVQSGIEILREYTDDLGNKVESTTIGSDLTVHIHVRAQKDAYLSNVAIVDLLPAGFEVIANSVKAETFDYTDIREDRVIFFGTLGSETKEIIYKIRATNAGTFQVPPAYAQSMYNPGISARGVGSRITVGTR